MLKKREGRNHALVRVNKCEKGGERFAEKKSISIILLLKFEKPKYLNIFTDI